MKHRRLSAHSRKKKAALLCESAKNKAGKQAGMDLEKGSIPGKLRLLLRDRDYRLELEIGQRLELTLARSRRLNRWSV